MIKIVRPTEPELFSSPMWIAARKRLEDSFRDQERVQRLMFDASILKEAKPDVVRMFRGKCAYCETRVDVGGFGDVDNFRPKAGARGLGEDEYAPMHYWWLAYEWENLVLSCQLCNSRYKRDLFPIDGVRAEIGAKGLELRKEKALLIDPTIDDPADHLNFRDDGMVVALSRQGEVTIEIVGLNRAELISNRAALAKKLAIDLRVLEAALGNDALKSEVLPMIQEIGDLFSDAPEAEHAAVQRAVFTKWYESNRSVWDKLSAGRAFVPEPRENMPPVIAPTEEQAVTFGGDDSDDELKTRLKQIKRFSLKSVEIENFKSIEKLTLKIEEQKEGTDRESWLLLLGDNGIGKSSILQAIALALCGQQQIDRLGLKSSEFLRNGAEIGRVKIWSYEQDDPVVLELDEKGFYTELQDPPTFLLAFGSTRLMPKGGIRPETEAISYLNVSNLFDYSVALHDPREWLGSIDKKEFDERVASAFFDVLALRDKDKVWLDHGKVIIRQFGDDHELESNSDGYKTVVSLVADIMRTLSIDKATYHNAQGIVLIDEIGNHLHPRWRLKIVGALRKAFPKLQFVVTTHEPLCLRGLSHGEVVVLMRDRDNDVKALDKALLPDHNLLRVDQLLTSDLFGLINVLDEETEKTYEDYYSLLSKPEESRTAEDRAKIEEYSATLAEKEALGSTPAVQALFQIVNETYAQKVRDEGFRTKEALKAETVEEIKEIMRRKELDWL